MLDISVFFCYNLITKEVTLMKIDSNTVVTMSEANKNFSRVARLVDQYGSAVVFKNSVPRYLVLDFAAADKMQMASDQDVIASTSALMDQFDDAFKELAK